MPHAILAVLLDSGDTLVDEGTEFRDADETVVRADLIPGAAELIHELKHRGYPLALVADGPVSTFRNTLGAHGLFDLFDVHAISEEVGVSKPHPAMFQRAVDRLGIARAEYGRVVMVGNNLERDVRGANDFGLISVWIDWAPRRSKIPAHAAEVPQYIIHRPIELVALLEKLERRASTNDTNRTNEHK
jgi:FMN phosphatase YigB (HAD superfamily)